MEQGAATFVWMQFMLLWRINNETGVCFVTRARRRAFSLLPSQRGITPWPCSEEDGCVHRGTKLGRLSVVALILAIAARFITIRDRIVPKVKGRAT